MKTPEKILFVITKSNFGGAQRYVHDLAVAYSSDDDCRVVVASGGAGVLVEKLEEKNVRTLSVPRLGRDIHPIDEVFVFFSLCSLFFRERPNVIHLNSSKIGGLGALAARVYNLFVRAKNLYPTPHPLRPARIIFTVHGWAFEEDRPVWQRVVIYLLSWMTVLFSHKTIAVSQYDAQKGYRMWGAQKKMYVIHNGRSEPPLVPREDARGMILGDRVASVPDDAVWVVALSELTKNKGVRYAIEGIYRLMQDEKLPRPIVCAVIGEGPEKHMLANLITRLGLEKTVFLVGFKKDAARLFSAFDLFLFPSIKEGLPYALIEAGWARLPVITTNVGGIPEIIKDGVTGMLIRPKEIGEIKRALSYALSHEQEMRTFGDALHAEVQKKFTLQHMIEETKKVYAAC